MKISKNIPLLIFILFGCFIYFFFLKNAHFSGSNPAQYMWLFNENVRSQVIQNVSTNESRKEDTVATYNFNEYKFTIFKISQKNIESDKIQLNYIDSFEYFERTFNGQILNKDAYPFPEVWVSSDVNFQDELDVNIDQFSTIDTTFFHSTYLGFLGNIYKLGIGIHHENFVLFDYKDKPTRTLFIYFKKERIIVVINSKDDFNIEILNLLNLSETNI
jgi:hypothetical protein